jgi:hypothetical protein
MRKECQKHVPEISGLIVNLKTVYITNFKPESTKLMKKQRMWDRVERIA